MSTEVMPQPELKKASLIQSMAATYNLEPAKFFETIRNTVFSKSNTGRDATMEDMIAFLVVANQYALNPFTGEIYAFPKKGGGIQAIVGVDGWYKLLNDNPQMDGIEFIDHASADGKSIEAITCRIYRKDRAYPVTCTEYLDECKKNTEPWNKWPRRMLRHKAAVQCARIAFALSGIVDPDEADRIQSVEPVRLTAGNLETPVIEGPVSGADLMHPQAAEEPEAESQEESAALREAIGKLAAAATVAEVDAILDEAESGIRDDERETLLKWADARLKQITEHAK